MLVERSLMVTVALGLAAAGAVNGAQRTEPRGEIMLEQSLAVAAGGRLEVDVGDGDVEVRTGGPGVHVEVRAWASDPEWAREVFERMEFQVGETRNTVTVAARDPRIRRNEWRRNRRFAVHVRITVPDRFDLNIQTSDGDVVIGDANGTVSVGTSDGDVLLGNVTAPKVVVETSDGDVTAGNIQADRTDLQTSDGDVRVGGASGDLQIRTSDGDIVVRFVQVTGARLSTDDGDITMYAASGLAADLTLEGEDLVLDRDILVQGTVSRRRIRGAVNGGGAPISARTSDGTIVLRRSN